MMQLSYYDVPQWLKDSEFFKNLSDDEPNACFEVPQECFRLTDDCVQTADDLIDILKVMRFWGLTCIPDSVLEFCYCNDALVWDPVVAEIIGEGSLEHKALKIAFADTNKLSLELALQLHRPEFDTFWLVKFQADGPHCESAIAQAARFGRLDLVQTLHERGFAWDVFAYCAAAQYGHLECLKYLREKGCPWDEKALIFAARGGQLQCMKFLHTHGCPWHEYVTFEYAVPAHCVFLSTCYSEFRPWVDDWSLTFPEGGCVECLQYALENGCPIHKYATSVPCEYGLLECLRVLHAHGAVWDPDSTLTAASYGHVECLALALQSGCPCDLYDMEAAASKGHLDCVRLLHQNGCPWEAFIAAAAAEKNQLDCLQYLHENGCPWNASTPGAAAEHGHLNCLRYVVEHGPPSFGKVALQTAVIHGHVGCVQYLIEERNLHHELSEDLFRDAFIEGHFAVVKYLIDIGCPFRRFAFTKAMRAAFTCTTRVDTEFLQCIQYAQNNGWQYNSYILEYISTELNLPLCQAHVEKEGWKRSAVDSFEQL